MYKNVNKSIKINTIMSKKRKTEPITTSNNPKKTKTSHWSTGLLDSIKDPKYLIKEDDLVYLIKDKYPKAQHHLLVISKEKLNSLKQVTIKHKTLLEHMENVAKNYIKQHENETFQIGYHAEPSMSRLHLHVISDDFNSECLKHKKHWNSFTTEFFLKSKDVRENLEKNQRVVLPSSDVCKKYLNSALGCHKCGYQPKNMPDLKRHIQSHLPKI